LTVQSLILAALIGLLVGIYARNAREPAHRWSFRQSWRSYFLLRQAKPG